MDLRCYQTRAVDAIAARFDAGDQRTLCVLPTGGGKTVVAGHVAKSRLPHGRVMVLVHREELLRQAAEKFAAITGVLPSIEKADERSDEENLHGKPPVVIASVPTLAAGGGRRLKRFDPCEFALCWLDEAHHAPAGSFRRCIDHFAKHEGCKVLGVTATADRADGEALGQVFQSVAFNYELPDIIADGYLVPIRQRMVTIEGLDFSKVRTTAGDLNAGDLERVMMREKPLHGVAHATIEEAAGLDRGTLTSLRDRDDRVDALREAITVAGGRVRRTLVFASSVAHATMSAEIINRWLPDHADHVDGKMTPDRRRTVLRRFKRGEIKFLVNCMVATEGFDEPGVELVVVARPTKSRPLYAQIVGRGTRPAESIARLLGTLETPDERRSAIASSEKPWLAVLDFAGNCGRHRLVCTADLLGATYEPAVLEAARKLSEGGTVDMTEALRDAQETLERKRREADEKRRKREEEDRRKRETEAAGRKGLVGTAGYELQDVDPFDRDGTRVDRDEGGRINPYPGADPEIPEKQLALMSKAKVPEADVRKMTPEDASRVTRELVRGWKLGLRSYKQAKLLRRHGYTADALHDMKMGEARAAIDAIAANGWKRPEAVAPPQRVERQVGEIAI